MSEQPAPKYLGIYLNDHLAGSTAGLELAKRAAGENEGGELGAFLAELREEIAEDRATLEKIMDELGVGRDQVKVVAAWVGEKAGRLKLNGHLTGYSPLSPLVELEALSLGIEGKRLMWVALAETLGDRIGVDRLATLTERAERQRAGVERHRLAAMRQVVAADRAALDVVSASGSAR
jgi:hypothetical protein